MLGTDLLLKLLELSKLLVDSLLAAALENLFDLLEGDQCVELESNGVRTIHVPVAVGHELSVLWAVFARRVNAILGKLVFALMAIG